MARTILAVGAVLVIGLGLALWIMSRTQDAASASTPSTRRDTATPAVDPSAPRPSPAAALAADKSANEVVVHDHRTGDSAPSSDLVEPNTTAKHDRDLPSQLTFDVTRGVKAAIAECASLIPAGERTGQARLRGSIDISIRDQIATINAADLSISGITGSSAETAKQCVAQKSLGLQAPAADQAAIEHYSIEVSFGIP